MNKIDDICFKCETRFKFKNKGNRICIKKVENKPQSQKQTYCKQQHDKNYAFLKGFKLCPLCRVDGNRRRDREENTS